MGTERVHIDLLLSFFIDSDAKNLQDSSSDIHDQNTRDLKPKQYNKRRQRQCRTDKNVSDTQKRESKEKGQRKKERKEESETEREMKTKQNKEKKIEKGFAQEKSKILRPDGLTIKLHITRREQTSKKRRRKDE